MADWLLVGLAAIVVSDCNRLLRHWEAGSGTAVSVSERIWRLSRPIGWVILWGLPAALAGILFDWFTPDGSWRQQSTCFSSYTPIMPSENDDCGAPTSWTGVGLSHH
jgi:hypothetical protein